MSLKSDAIFEEKLTRRLENDMRNMANFHQGTWKLWLWWDPLIQSRKCMSLKFSEELCVMTMKNDAKFKEELNNRFKIDMRNLTNCDLSTWKSWCKMWRKTDLYMRNLANFHRLKNSNFILENKMAELNQNKSSKQADRSDPMWELYFTLEINE